MRESLRTFEDIDQGVASGLGWILFIDALMMVRMDSHWETKRFAGGKEI